MPHCCAKVGVVTSPTGAVIHDITNVSLRRQPFTQIVLYPVKVQGVGADKEICQGIRYMDGTDVDVIIVGRGGGSNEDLSVFNSEDIVRAIAACNKPVVSAVGHGVDFTLCDFVADKRAVTPSEAAEFVTVDVVEQRARVCAILDKIQRSVARQDCIQAKLRRKHRAQTGYAGGTHCGTATHICFANARWHKRSCQHANCGA